MSSSKVPKMSHQNHYFGKLEKQLFWLSWWHDVSMSHILPAVDGGNHSDYPRKFDELNQNFLPKSLSSQNGKCKVVRNNSNLKFLPHQSNVEIIQTWTFCHINQTLK